jgi:hypothetical protein
MKQILTIVIPTFNHHDFLKEQLFNLMPQLTNEIKIYIIDNFSNPTVNSFLEKEGFDTTLFTIIQNGRNIGGDRNILKAYKIDDAEWIWVLSDNDFVEANAIQKVLNIIKANKNAVFINFATKDNHSRSVKGYKEFCLHACYWASFSISHIVFNTIKISPYMAYYEEQIKTHQPQLLTILKYLKDNDDDVCFFAEIDLFINHQLPTWSKAAFINDTFLVYDIISSEDIIFFKKTIGKQLINTLFYLLVIARIYEGLSFKNYIHLLFKIVKHTPKSHLIFNKSFIVCLLCVICPKILYLYRKLSISANKDYVFSDVSRNLYWND